ncbi:UDP-N-acetylmuramyl pentapeptide phosphotransferase [Microbacterium sp. P06]|uniref:UDP-N-acetylmuramyl pentapeptide phosphotransferase n=1 Tax=unclassified Microbacterium TaxID=2609290 RepID=UPI00374614F5
MSAQSSQSAPQTGAQAVVADAVAHAASVAHGASVAPVDPARRPDVLFRVRREEGHEASVWWMIGAFVVVSGAVITILSFVPGGA